MPLLSKIEAAMHLGISVELLEYFTSHCPKREETRLLKSILVGTEPHFEVAELDSYRAWLSTPWKRPADGQRPRVPSAIATDIRQESHHMCAICGDMNNGEVAHIRAVADSFNNSPDNLILLCPNHHTQYDLGHRPSSNVSMEAILAAKVLKRNSRIRIMRVEKNATTTLYSITRALRDLESRLEKTPVDSQNHQVLKTESITLLKLIPELSAAAQAEGKKDKDPTPTELLLAQKAPALAKLALGANSSSKESTLRTTMKAVVQAVDEVMIELDEVDCPRCGGRGTTGLVGDLCRYCGGSCYVSTAQAEAYSEADIDEVACPHCTGKGQTGLVGDLCAFCGGSCFVSHDMADDYNPNDIDEVPCPRCNGRGQTGLVGDICAFCGGSCNVSKEAAEKYDPDDTDEVPCPRCNGRGQTGRVGDICALCGGSCSVSEAKAAAYRKQYNV